MSNMLHGSTFFCMAISLFGYEAGIFLRKKLKIGIFNPLLVSIVFVIIVLKVELIMILMIRERMY